MFSDDLARLPIGVKASILFIDLWSTRQVTTSTTSQNDIAGADRTYDRRSSVGIPAFCTPCVLSLSGIRLA
jgi:hypothetical protein